MKAGRKVYFYGNHFQKFYRTLDFDARKKVDWVIGLVCDLNIVPSKFFKNIKGTEGLYEIRIMVRRNIMSKKGNRNLISYGDHLVKEYGEKGTHTRDRFEQEFEAFKIGILIQEARKKKQLTQTELALKVGTTKNYISRIENDASDIRLSTLIRIIQDGLGGHLTLTLDV